MQLKYKDSESIFSTLCYDKEQNIFIIKSKINDSEIIYYPTLMLDSEYDIKNFSYVLFYNENSCENNIYQVYTENERIGWIFPIQALLSAEHSYVDDEYFLKYAYVATYLLLDSIDQIDKINFPQEFILADYVNETKCILVYDNENIKKIKNFDLSDYTVSFFKYGYEYNGKGNFNPVDNDTKKKLKIVPLANELRGNSSINDLFVEQFLLASNAIIKFHICYQVIELLITKIFEHKFRLIAGKLSSDSENLFELREDLSKITTEKERIKCLFENYTKCETCDKKELGAACEEFLKLNNKKSSSNFYYDLYTVRCLLVHKLYSINKESHSYLDRINDSLLHIVMTMLFTFQYPQDS